MEKIVVANWKSFKSPKETKIWIEEFLKLAIAEKFSLNGKVILCTPFIDLFIAKEALSRTLSSVPFFLGSQNLSPFEDGPYTGEVSAHMLKDLVEYVMIGHSERRTHFKEDDTMINQKIALAQKYGLKQIVCVSELSQVESIKKGVPEFDQIILFEPLFAIGSGQADTPENASKMVLAIKNLLTGVKVIYGGSVKPENVTSFYSQPSLDGVAVGGASLDPLSFFRIVQYAA